MENQAISIRETDTRLTGSNLLLSSTELRKWSGLPEKHLQWLSLQQKGVFEEEKALLAVKTLVNIQEKTLLNISEAYQSKSASLATFRKYMSDADTKTMLWLMIEPTLKAINVGRGISKEGIESFVEYIMQEFYFLKFEELKVFFQMVIYFFKI